MSFDPHSYLSEQGRLADGDIDVARCALAFSAIARSGLNIERYIHHLQDNSALLCDEYEGLLDAGAPGDARDKLAAIKTVFSTRLGYHGNEQNYDDLQNADLAAVIDNRKGLPIALSILCLQAARAQGWHVDGVNFPGHFFCRIDDEGERVLFDPFHGCQILEAPDLRAQLKKSMGRNAELSMHYLDGASNRDILLRLQNNIKLRQIDAEDYASALATVRMMRLVAPDDYRLALDAGVLGARTGAKDEAVEALEYYIDNAPDPADRYDAQLLLDQLRGV